MSARPRDRREYVRVAVDLPLHPKLVEAGEPAVGWLYVTGLCYSGQHLTDGEIPPAAVVRLAGVDKRLADRLVEVGLWHRPGHDCDDCPQPGRGHVIVHDYLEHQRSADDAKTLRQARRDAGVKGAAKRWGKHGNTDDNRHGNSDGNSDGEPAADRGTSARPTTADESAADESAATLAESPADDHDPDQRQQQSPTAHAIASAIAGAKHKPWQPGSKPMPEVEGEEEEELLPPDGGSGRARARTRGATTVAELAATAVRPDAYRLVSAWRTETGAGYRPATVRALAKHADGILRDGGDPAAVRAALDEWNRRPDARPGLLPYLYDDAVKAQHKPARTAATGMSTRDAKAAGWFALAAELAAEDADATATTPDADVLMLDGGRS